MVYWWYCREAEADTPRSIVAMSCWRNARGSRPAVIIIVAPVRPRAAAISRVAVTATAAAAMAVSVVATMAKLALALRVAIARALVFAPARHRRWRGSVAATTSVFS